MSLVLEGVGVGIPGAPVLEDVSLQLERGSLNVLLGPTLSGKTSLMRVMAGLDRPDHGRVLMDGADVTGVPVRRRSVAMVYQQFVNYPTLSVYENIASPLRVAGLPRAEIEARVRDAARLLRLDPLLRRTPAQLSGGQQQRTAIARALVKRAALVLLDEPLANLDYKLREELREELPALFAQTGAILVYATTEPMEALLLGGRTTTLWEGRVTASGPAADTYRHPPNLPAARVFSDPPLNELPVEARGGQLHLPDGQVLPGLLGLPDGSWRLGFRAEHLQVGRPPPGFLGLQGRVNVTEITGSESYVHVDAGVATWVALLRGVADLPPGEAVQVHVDPRCIMAFDPAGRHVMLAPTAPSRAVA